jgi:hypothetical protein
MKSVMPTSQEIEELVAFLPRLYEKGFSPVKRWHGGNKDHNGVIIMPWPEYEPVVEEFIRISSAECWTDYKYQNNLAEQMLNNEDAIKTADLAQIKTMLTYCVRGERFCTGHWSAAIENGQVRRLLQRLADL